MNMEKSLSSSSRSSVKCDRGEGQQKDAAGGAGLDEKQQELRCGAKWELCGKYACYWQRRCWACSFINIVEGVQAPAPHHNGFCISRAKLRLAGQVPALTHH